MDERVGRRGELDVTTRKLRLALYQIRVCRLQVHHRRARVRNRRGHTSHRDDDLNSGVFGKTLELFSKTLPLRVRFRSVQDQNRNAGIILNKIEGDLGYIYAHDLPVVDRHGWPVCAVINQSINIECCHARHGKRREQLLNCQRTRTTSIGCST